MLELHMELATVDHQQILREKVSNLIVYVQGSGNLLSDIGSDHRHVTQRQYSSSNGIQEKNFQWAQ